jgi:hypothetical protein
MPDRKSRIFFAKSIGHVLEPRHGITSGTESAVGARNQASPHGNYSPHSPAKVDNQASLLRLKTPSNKPGQS